MEVEAVLITPALRLSAMGDLIEVHLFGRLTRADYDAAMPLLEQRLKRYGKLRFLSFLDDFYGWEPAALWKEIKFDVLHRQGIGPIAMVGDSTWQKLTADVSKFFFPSPVRFFEKKEAAEARAWLATAESKGGPTEAGTAV